MKIDILTLFPEMFDNVFNESIIKRAKDKNLVNILWIRVLTGWTFIAIMDMLIYHNLRKESSWKVKHSEHQQW